MPDRGLTTPKLGASMTATWQQIEPCANGGDVTTGLYALPTNQPTSWSEDHIPFTKLMGIGTGGHGLSLSDTPYLVEEWVLPSPVVLLSGDGHYWIGLDYRTYGALGEPSVFDTDSGAELPLAADCRAFVEGLRPLSRFE
ncbi:hypothetical protein JTP77_025645 [Streptomyces sp. S9]|nr:hypothetical protein [Streptomyces sp. S9]